jgi:hypothetical protein
MSIQHLKAAVYAMSAESHELIAATLYCIKSSGSLAIKTHLAPYGSAPDFFPRVGLNIRLNNGLDSTE